MKPIVVVQAYNLCTWAAEVEGVQVPGQNGLHRVLKASLVLHNEIFSKHQGLGS
jgi:hypothetical protein